MFGMMNMKSYQSISQSINHFIHPICDINTTQIQWSGSCSEQDRHGTESALTVAQAKC